MLRQLGGNSGRKRTFLTKVVPVLPLPVGDEGTVEPDESTFEGSYVAVSGRPGSRTVHVVNGRGGVNLAGTGTVMFCRFKQRCGALNFFFKIDQYKKPDIDNSIICLQYRERMEFI